MWHVVLGGQDVDQPLRSEDPYVFFKICIVSSEHARGNTLETVPPIAMIVLRRSTSSKSVSKKD